VSYSWSYTFGVVYAALEAFEEHRTEAGEPQSFFFIDQLCLDQHEMSSTAHDQADGKYKKIVQQLQTSIRVPGNVLMLLHPWSQPVVLGRAWCLFEIFTAICEGCQVQMCFAPADAEGFFDALRAGEFDARAVCNALDARQARATVEGDKTMITQRIEEQMTLESYNQKLRGFLIEQYRLTAVRAQRDMHHQQHASDQGGGVRRGSRGGRLTRSYSRGAVAAAPLKGGDDFNEVLKHLRRVHTRLEAMEEKQEQAAQRLASVEAKMDAALTA